MGKGWMFMAFVWLVVVIAGNMMQGDVQFVRTSLTSAVAIGDTTIHVKSTSGFPSCGILVLEDERIAYSSKTSTSFAGALVQPLLRGAQNTEAVAHTVGKNVTTVPGAMLNTSANYNVAVISDSAGLMAFVAVPVAIFQLLVSFFFLPLNFLGTDLQILTFVWAIIGAGMVLAFAMNMSGGRRV